MEHALTRAGIPGCSRVTAQKTTQEFIAKSMVGNLLLHTRREYWRVTMKYYIVEKENDPNFSHDLRAIFGNYMTA